MPSSSGADLRSYIAPSSSGTGYREVSCYNPMLIQIMTMLFPIINSMLEGFFMLVLLACKHAC